MEALEHCNLCGGSRFTPFAEMIGPTSGLRLQIVTCEGCGLRFMSPRMTESENAALYDEAYFNGKGFDGSINYVDQEEERVARAEETAGTLEKLALFKPGTELRVLDVGCGTGGLLTALTAAGYRDVWGVELSPYAAAIAKERSGTRVLVGDILSTDLPAGSFDAINATEVIEHLRDPRAFFERAYELLAPGGVFLYSTGNARCLYARVLGKRWPYLLEGHLFYFDPTTLARYFREAKLDAVDTRELGRKTHGAFVHAEGRIAAGQLLFVGRGDSGLKGRIYRFAAAFDSSITRRAMTRVLGKDTMPIAFKRV
jgi:SAM-dependent methyltransferase